MLPLKGIRIDKGALGERDNAKDSNRTKRRSFE